jgi:hypothetical protein
MALRERRFIGERMVAKDIIEPATALGRHE